MKSLEQRIEMLEKKVLEEQVINENQIAEISTNKNMEIRIKTVLGTFSGLEAVIEGIRKIEKEYSCNCTLLEVEFKW